MRPSAFDQLIDEFAKLPGIGKRSAERIAFALLKGPAEDAMRLADAIRTFTTDLKICSVCGHATESDPCPICADPKRDASTVLVVEQPSDIFSTEATGAYRGHYHVLMGRVALLDGIGPGELNIDGLIQRVQRGGIREVILGTQPSLEGDGTALLLADTLTGMGVNVTQLARGVPTGSSLQTVSKAVLADAIQSRRNV